LISQSKNLSPASPDHSVPSQSKAATRGFNRTTASTNSSCVGVNVCVRDVSMPLDNNVEIEEWATCREGKTSGYDSVRVSKAV